MNARTRSGRVIIASTRAATGVYEDRCGPIIVDWLNERGIATPAPTVVADGIGVNHALFAAIGEKVDVIITSGGTGISPTDRTADATANIVDYQIPGLADAIRRSGLPHVPTSVLSRGVCGVRDGTLIVNLPGSTGGVKDGLGVLDDVLGARAGSARRHGPPAMTAVVLRADLTEHTIDLAEHEELVAHQAAGAVVELRRCRARSRRRTHGDAAGVLRAPVGAADAGRGGRRDRGRVRTACGRSPSATASARWRSAMRRWSPRSRPTTGRRRSRRVPGWWTASRRDYRCGSTSSSPTAPTNGWARPKRAATAAHPRGAALRLAQGRAPVR